MKLGQPRKIPEIPLHFVDDYAQLIGEGWDTIKESFNLSISQEMQDRLQRLKEQAVELNESEGRALTYLGTEEFQVSAKGAKGVVWWLSNADFEVPIRSPKTEYCVTVRYRAAALWQYGLHELRERVIAFLQALGTPKCRPSEIEKTAAWSRISEAHWCWDFHSPAFTPEMRPALLEQAVCHSSVKVVQNLQLETWGTSAKTQTLTFSKHGNSCTVQVYDKGREITEASGKTWMAEVWAQWDFTPPDGPQKFKDIWRLEVRLKSEFLRSRGILTIYDLRKHFCELYSEALISRRLAWPSATDGNKRRWPAHPLWSMALQDMDHIKEYRPLGKRATEAPAVKVDRLKRLIGGTLRTASVVRGHGADFDTRAFLRLGKEAMWEALKDPDHEKKVETAQEKHRYAYCAQ